MRRRHCPPLNRFNWGGFGSHPSIFFLTGHSYSKLLSILNRLYGLFYADVRLESVNLLGDLKVCPLRILVLQEERRRKTFLVRQEFQAWQRLS